MGIFLRSGTINLSEAVAPMLLELGIGSIAHQSCKVYTVGDPNNMSINT